MPDIKQLKVKIGTDLTEFDRGLRVMNTRLESARRDVQQKYGELSSSVARIGTAMTVGLTVPFVGFVSAAMKTAIKMDTLERGLIAVTGSAAEASKQLKTLKEMATLPGLSLDVAVQGATRLQGVQYEGKEAARIMREFGNAVALVGGGSVELDHVLVQLMQMKSVGRVLSADVKPIMGYIPQLGVAMKEAFGTASLDKLQQMGVTAEQFIDGIVNQFKKLNRAGGGVATEIQKMQVEWTMALDEFGQGMIPVMTLAVTKVTKLLHAFKGLSPGWKSFVLGAGAIAAAGGPAIISINSLIQSLGSLKAGVAAIRAFAIARKAAATATAAATESATALTALKTAADLRAIEASAARVAMTNAHTAAMTANNAAIAAGVAIDDIETAAGQRAGLARIAHAASIRQFTIAEEAATVASAAHAAALQAHTAAFGTNTAAAAANTAAQTANAMANNAAATSATTATAASNAAAATTATTAAAANAIGAAATSAAVGIRAFGGALMGLVTSPVTIVLAAIVAGILLVRWQIKRVLAEAQNAARAAATIDPAQAKRNMENVRAQSEGRDVSTNRSRADNLQTQIEKMNADLADAESRAKWYKPGSAMAISEVEVLKKNLARKQLELDIVQDVIRVQQESIAAVKELAESAKQKYAENERANDDARAAMWVMSQATDYEKDRAQAWVDYVSEQRKINDIAADALATEKIVLDTTDQLAAAKMSYLHRLREIADNEAEEKKQIAEKAAEQREHELELIKTREKTMAAAVIADNLAQREGNAINSGNKYDRERVGHLRSWVSTMQECAELMEDGLPWAGRVYAAQAALAEANRQTQANEIADQAKRDADAIRAALDDVKDHNDALIALAEARGDRELAERLRYSAESDKIRDYELDAGADSTKLATAAARQEALQVEHEKAMLDIRTGGAKSFMDKARQWKDEEVRGWQERIDKAKQFYEELRNGVRFMSGTQLWESAVTDAGKAMIPAMPYIPPPNYEITAEDTARYWDRQSYENQEQIDALRNVTEQLKALAFGGGLL